MKEFVLKVEGMSCGHCVGAVEGALQQVGVQGSVDLSSKKVTIQYDESKVTLDQIVQAIEDQGYDVVK